MDLRGYRHSSILSAVDAIVPDDAVKVVSWYDTEWGYACRIADLVHVMRAQVPPLAAFPGLDQRGIDR
jgi:glyceraldehyde 3-phosphate dehydrogenase